MLNLGLYSKFINIITASVLLAIIFFQIQNLSTLSSEIDDIGVYHTIVEAKKRKNELYKTINESSESELIHEIKTKAGDDAMTLALYLEKAHILKPTLKFIANYKSFYAVSIGLTYAPGPYFITNLLINGEESYQTAKMKIRAVSKLFWVLGIIGLIIIFSKLKEQNITQAALLFLVLITCSQSQTSYSAHGSNYAAGLLASSIALLVIINIFKSGRLSISNVFLLILVALIQYQLIPLIFIIFLIIWLRFLFFDNLAKKEKVQILTNLMSCSALFALMFFVLVFPTFKDKLGSGLNWNVGLNKEYTLLDNYQILFHEVTFQNFITLFIESFSALIDTFSSLYSPLPFSYPGGKLIGLLSIALTSVAFFKLSKKKLLKPFIAASATILALHFLLYLLGVIPLSPTRHSLYLTVPLTVLCVIASSHLITILEIWYPKLTTPLLSFGILLLAISSGYMNVSYISKRVDPFNEPKVVALLASEVTPTVIINSDWTYQHYAMSDLKKTKYLIDLNLTGKRNNFQEQLEKIRPVIGAMNAGDTIYLMRISHWGPPDKDNSQVNEITDTICNHFKYKCMFKANQELFSSTKNASPEWVENIQGFSNSLYINKLSISVLGSTSKH